MQPRSRDPRYMPTPALIFWLFLAFSAVACSEDDSGPCAGEDCSGHGTCMWDADGTPYCRCWSGYKVTGTDLLTCTKYEIDTNNTKPIIYLYPEATTSVVVRFGAPETMGLAYTYPAYPEGGWEVIADPDGTLTDPGTGRKYYALYWEGTVAEPEIPEEGFVIAGAEVIPFLEEVLPRLGLNWSEADEFIIYWLPILGENPWNFITFLTDEWARAVPLEVWPAPDTSIRFSMRWARLQAPPTQVPTPQTLVPVPRLGFTLVEWGGREIPAPVR